MSTVVSFAVPLATVALTLGGGWLVTNRITDYWDEVRKNREMNLAAALEFQRLYGEAISIWKTWSALRGSEAATYAWPDDAKWACLVRATAAEGAVEALIAKVVAERPDTVGDRDPRWDSAGLQNDSPCHPRRSTYRLVLVERRAVPRIQIAQRCNVSHVNGVDGFAETAYRQRCRGEFPSRH